TVSGWNPVVVGAEKSTRGSLSSVGGHPASTRAVRTSTTWKAMARSAIGDKKKNERGMDRSLSVVTTLPNKIGQPRDIRRIRMRARTDLPHRNPVCGNLRKKSTKYPATRYAREYCGLGRLIFAKALRQAPRRTTLTRRASTLGDGSQCELV